MNTLVKVGVVVWGEINNKRYKEMPWWNNRIAGSGEEEE
jgi:hypothetical protein